jgi:hypothetical protein
MPNELIRFFLVKKLTVPSESAPQELSNEWSCQYDLTI